MYPEYGNKIFLPSSIYTKKVDFVTKLINGHSNGAVWQIIYCFGIYVILWRKVFTYYLNLIDQCSKIINDIEEDEVHYFIGLISN